MMDLYMGLMSGTSMDGVDGVLVDFSGPSLKVLAAASSPLEDDFRAELLALNSPGANELHRAALAGNRIAAVYAQVVHALMAQAAAQGIKTSQIRAIGAHGQTVRHQPKRLSAAPHGTGYTLQLNNPALLAELTGVDVVADFRSRDVAAGGQGAPLVPAFHQSLFGRAGQSICVLNIGGISNVSILPANPAEPVIGFDCGPGNALMDAWCQQHTGQPFDTDGVWAASGQLLPQLLASLLDEPYLKQPPPKSTGRDLFSQQWLHSRLAPFLSAKPADIQNTLTEFTACACVADINSYGKYSKELIACGGGALNKYLMQRLQAGLPDLQVLSSQDRGLPPLQVEASAFAWLARQTVNRQPGNLSSVTGAAGPRILGAIYPA